MRFDILTIFPEMFSCYFDSSMMKKAIDDDLIEVNVHNLRNWSQDKHKTVDDVAYGGISGMVMKVEPIYHAVKDLVDESDSDNIRVVLLSPRGEILKQDKVRELHDSCDQLILIAGHYKGVDGRVIEYIVDEEISIGEYVITGGELPAQVLVDAVSRMVPGVIGSPESKEGESFSEGVRHEHKVYTRPESFETEEGDEWDVPEVLTSGHHQKIKEWRDEKRKYEDSSNN